MTLSLNRRDDYLVCTRGPITGYFPIKLEALAEGSAVHARVPVYQVRDCTSRCREFEPRRPGRFLHHPFLNLPCLSIQHRNPENLGRNTNVQSCVQILIKPTPSHLSPLVTQITAEKEYAPLCTFFEALLTQLWCVVVHV